MFFTSFPQEGFFSSKTEKVNTNIVYIILHIQISLVQNSAQTDNFDFLDQICPKRYFQSKIEKMNITMEFCIFELV